MARALACAGLLSAAAAQQQYGGLCNPSNVGAPGVTPDGCTHALPPTGQCRTVPVCDNNNEPPMCTFSAALPDGAYCDFSAESVVLGVGWITPSGTPTEGLCRGAVCFKKAGCSDGTLNGDEQSIDCGGSCRPCTAAELNPEVLSVARGTPTPTIKDAAGRPEWELAISWIAIGIAGLFALLGGVSLLFCRDRMQKHFKCLRPEEDPMLIARKRAAQTAAQRPSQQGQHFRVYFDYIGDYVDRQLAHLQSVPEEIGVDEGAELAKQKREAIAELNLHLRHAIIEAFRHHDVDENNKLDPDESSSFFGQYAQECFRTERPVMAYVVEGMWDELCARAVTARGQTAAVQLEWLTEQRRMLTQGARALARTRVSEIREDYQRNRAEREASAFAVLDTSKDGRLTLDEVVAGLSRGAPLNARFEQVFFQMSNKGQGATDPASKYSESAPPPRRTSVAVVSQTPTLNVGKRNSVMVPVAAAEAPRSRRQSHSWKDVGGKGTMAQQVSIAYDSAAKESEAERENLVSLEQQRLDQLFQYQGKGEDTVAAARGRMERRVSDWATAPSEARRQSIKRSKSVPLKQSWFGGGQNKVTPIDNPAALVPERRASVRNSQTPVSLPAIPKRSASLKRSSISRAASLAGESDRRRGSAAGLRKPGL
eukprot:TRINITY_DN21405_c0_g1_i2.p1 TRINITY_DN21405_c0_g1~~TRINITY_DN21405_c0_g1_i2.p1  ORF type:complete len:667 (+),score=179.97 TRINITY_DN21405_c0_g1_i2:43-2001(+)